MKAGEGVDCVILASYSYLLRENGFGKDSEHGSTRALRRMDLGEIRVEGNGIRGKRDDRSHFRTGSSSRGSDPATRTWSTNRQFGARFTELTLGWRTNMRRLLALTSAILVTAVMALYMPSDWQTSLSSLLIVCALVLASCALIYRQRRGGRSPRMADKWAAYLAAPYAHL
jgi:hypothetical protein